MTIPDPEDRSRYISLRDDPFVRLLEWVITGFGYNDLLLRLEQHKKLENESVDRRTLEEWRNGGYPQKKRSSKVELVHRLSRELRDYPPPRGAGRSLVELSGPGAAAALPSLPVDSTTSTLDAREPLLGATAGLLDGGSSESREPAPTAQSDVPAAKRRPLVTAGARAATLALLLAGVGGGYLVRVATEPAPVTQPSPRSHLHNPADPSLPARPGLVVEVAAGRHDKQVPVYASPKGAAVAAGIPTRIPYRTPVYVRCRARNVTGGMPSVAGFYLIVGGTWDGLYAVSNGFTNGDPLGTQGGHNLDKTIPVCPPHPRTG